MRNTIHKIFKAGAEYVIPVRSASAFDQEKVLTPAEFVEAGDYLVRACPTWSWESGDARKFKSYLPKDKQYLVTRNVPCHKRASAVEECDLVEEDGDDDWVTTTAGRKQAQDNEDVPSLGEESPQAEENDDEVPDIDALDIDDEEEADEAAVPASKHYVQTKETDNELLNTRSYDLMISYDQFYAVPRFWLVGYDEHRHPLQGEQIMEDTSAEHRHKTVTVETFPHSNIRTVSIHPCKHASVMKTLSESMGNELRVDQYLILFLKFIASVIPTIEYDYTMQAGS